MIRSESRCFFCVELPWGSPKTEADPNLWPSENATLMIIHESGTKERDQSEICSFVVENSDAAIVSTTHDDTMFVGLDLSVEFCASLHLGSSENWDLQTCAKHHKTI